jgi:hypothetical protein
MPCTLPRMAISVDCARRRPRHVVEVVIVLLAAEGLVRGGMHMMRGCLQGVGRTPFRRPCASKLFDS